jgi:hypothetical protein
MARVNSAVAAKDYPHKGIKKGDTYYFWQLYKQPKQMSLTRPRPSQLTGSDKLSRAYAAGEQMEDIVGEATTIEDIAQALRDAADQVREVSDEYGESADNMEEAFPNGSPTIELCRENQDNLAGYADELEGAADEVEGLDIDDFIDEEAQRSRAIEMIEDKYEGEGEPPVPSDDEIDAWVEKNKPDNFDDLTDAEREAMLEEARSIAGNPSCPL